jgi:hypothetical protein
VNVSIKN